MTRRAIAQPEEPREILNASEAARLLGVDKQTVYDYAGKGEIPCKRLGRRMLFSRTALVAWVAGKAA